MWNGILLVTLTLITVLVLIKNHELKDLDEILKNLNYGYLGLAVLAMVVNTLFDSAILKMNTDYLEQKIVRKATGAEWPRLCSFFYY